MTVVSRLPVSQRLAPEALPAGRIGWSFPALPADAVAAVEDTWNVSIHHDTEAASPFSYRSAAAVLGSARSEQIVRGLSSRTNLVLPGARTLVIGSGPLADVVTETLTRLGGRVIRASDDPTVRLRAHLAGLATVAVGDQEGWPIVDFTLVTGEGHVPLDPGILPAVSLDASLAATGIAPASGPLVRPQVHRTDSARRVVDPVPLLPGRIEEASPLEWRIIDVIVALSLLVAGGADAATTDARLAEAVLA